MSVEEIVIKIHEVCNQVTFSGKKVQHIFRESEKIFQNFEISLLMTRFSHYKIHTMKTMSVY